MDLEQYDYSWLERRNHSVCLSAHVQLKGDWAIRVPSGLLLLSFSSQLDSFIHAGHHGTTMHTGSASVSCSIAA